MEDKVISKRNEIFDMFYQMRGNKEEIKYQENQLKKVNFILIRNWWKELETEIDCINFKLFKILNTFKAIVWANNLIENGNTYLSKNSISNKIPQEIYGK